MTKGTSIKETELIITTATQILTLQIEKELSYTKAKNIYLEKDFQNERKIVTKKERRSISYMKENLIDFGGTMTDSEVIKVLNLARNTFYKYKKKIRQGIY